MITQLIKQTMALMVSLVVSLVVYATDGTIVVNNPMPSREVSVIATQAVILKSGFHAVATSGTFDAKIGKINSVYPALTLAEGSGSVQTPPATEAVAVSKSNVKITIPLQETTVVSTLNEKNSLVIQQYYDGLGRKNMSVVKNYSPTGKDLATVVNYDEYGRVSNKWLATPINSATTPEPGIVMQQAKNYYGDDNPYYTVDPSAFTTVSTYKPGAALRTNGKASQQGLPSAFLSDVKRYVINENNITLLPNPFSNIQFQQTTDEDGHTGYVVTDFNGKVVLKRMVNAGANYDTYFLYDDLGQLCYVLSPEASDQMAIAGDYLRNDINTATTILAQYAYAYTYDAAGRCIAKKIPGKAWQNIIYDQANQVAFTQDGNQLPSGQWTYYKYDNQGRPIQSGTTVLSSPTTTRTTYASIKAEESYKAGVGYSSTKSLGSDTKLLTQQFYDSYDFLTLTSYSALASNLAYSGPQGANYSNVVSNVDIALLGKLTGIWVAMLETTTTPLTLLTALYYDNKGHVIQSNASNQLGGYDKDSYTYNFSGQMLTNTHVHTNSTTTVTELYTLSYDHAGRATSVRHKLNTQPEIVMFSLQYDETGRPTRKILHGGMQTVDYAYNLQGQLKSISSSAFSEALMYSDPDPNGTPLYNGSIASVQYGNGSGYRYTYDGLNRLKTAAYTDAKNTANNGTFSETVDTYDKNGNIVKLTRSGLARDMYNMAHGFVSIVKQNLDQLTMDYAGNQVQKTVDANNPSQYLSVGTNDFYDMKDDANPNAAEYQYDKNGNCTADLNKSIAWTTYNLLNRPQTVQMTTGNKTYYAYDAAGVKRRAEYYWAPEGLQVPLGDTSKELGKNNYGTPTSSSWTDYCGRYVYVDGTLTRILTPEGYVQVSGSDAANWRYAYNLTDHVGSSRAQLLSDPLSNATSKGYTVASTSEYYPMGMEIRRTDAYTSGTNPYLYGGNELERMHGLNLYEFPYRSYDYAVPGFTTPDPLAEKHYSESPYSYCGGDPVNRVDPSGLDWYLTSDHVWIGYIAQSPGPATEFKDGRTYTNQGPDMTYSCGGQLFYCDFFGNIRSTGSNKSETVDQYKSRLSDENLTKYPNAYASDANKLLFLNSRTPLLTMNGDGTFHELSPDILNPQPLGIPTEFLSTEEIKVTLQSLDEPSAMPMTEAYLNGLADGVGSVGDMIVHPINTINDVGNAIIHYDDTYNAFNNLINDYAAAIRNGDGQKVAYQTGNFLGMLAGGEAAGGAASRLGQAGKAAWLGRANGLSQEMINLTESNITSNGKTVLGHWPEYIDKAKGMNASYFDLGNAWEPNTGPLANKYFLDVISNRGDQIFLSVPKFQIRAGSQLVDEINYLTGEKGYIWINQWSLIKK